MNQGRRGAVRSGLALVFLSAGLIGTAGLAGVTATPAAAANGVNTTSLNIQRVWTKATPGCGAPFDFCGFGWSSPTDGNLDGRDSVIVGSRDGRVYALHLDDGSPSTGWSGGISTGSPVDSSPSVAVENGQTNVFVGSGSVAAPRTGGYFSYDAFGNARWRDNVADVTNRVNAVTTALAIGDTNRNGVADVVGGAQALTLLSMGTNGAVNPGFPYATDDSVFSSPALADVNGDGKTDIIIGGDSSPGALVPWQGGILRAVDGSGGTLWQQQFNEITFSSPVVADLGTGGPKIVVGSGDYWSRTTNRLQSDATKVFVRNMNGTPNDVYDLGAYTLASPLLADVMGVGGLDIVEGTWGGTTQEKALLPDPSRAGMVNVIDPRTHQVVRSRKMRLSSDVLAQPVTADLNGDGAEDLIVAGAGADLYDVKHDTFLGSLSEGEGISYQNSPLVHDNGNGTLDIVLAGTRQSDGMGIIEDYRVLSTTHPRLGPLGTRMARNNARRTGSWLDAPLTQTLCPNPCTTGYWLAGSDGAVYSFGNAQFYGSAAGSPLARPVVAIASTPNKHGYWMAATDGGVFSYGNASFLGSTGNVRLNKPIVGMASTPSGNGYWLVASDGGIFSFGDAHFYGSTGAVALNQPIVGMTSTPSGHGYWLVASDGGMFSFGDAPFYGSTGNVKLNRPIVGMTSTPSGHGYWLVASDGGIFSFGDAPFYGSTGAVKLVSPIVGIASTPAGHGYRMVAADGGLFAFGDASFVGSIGGAVSNHPVVGLASVA